MSHFFSPERERASHCLTSDSRNSALMSSLDYGQVLG